MINVNTIYNENCLDTMKRMPDEFIDLTVTSPPYDNLRTYKGYVFPFEDIAKELYRVTKQGGVVVWVVGDATIDKSETGTSFKQALFFMQCGFKLHDTMIYQKESITWNVNSRRYKQNFEYMFIFCKKMVKSFNAIKDIAVKNLNKRLVKSHRNTKNPKYDFVYPNEITARSNIWTYKPGNSSNEIKNHPAVFPEQLAADHIYSWSNEGDLVYDPFGGSGTTAKMAHQLNRNWVLSEISSEYCEIAQKRIAAHTVQIRIF